MLVRDALATTKARLHAAGCDSPALEAEELLGFVLDVSRGQLLAMRSFAIEDEQLSRLEHLTARRESREPIAYIIEETDFYSRRFRVRAGVLVPRVDTEILVSSCLEVMGKSGVVLELGCGSGCVINSLLAERKGWRGIAVDLSPIALQVTAENAEIHDGAERLRCFEGSWYSALPDRCERFDLIVSNPPYIDPRERNELMPEVGVFEPPMALFAEEHGLAAYREILSAAPDWLKEGGAIALELGAGQAEDVKALAEAASLHSFTTSKDTLGHQRVLRAHK